MGYPVTGTLMMVPGSKQEIINTLGSVDSIVSWMEPPRKSFIAGMAIVAPDGACLRLAKRDEVDIQCCQAEAIKAFMEQHSR